MTANYVVSPGGSALIDAARWVEGVLQGSVAVSIALLAIAALGFLMLRGQLPVQRGLTVILGCFIFFGASSIARGLAGATLADRESVHNFPVSLLQVPQARPDPPKPNTVMAADPYAGASLPQ